jgi:hypothetical protein
MFRQSGETSEEIKMNCAQLREDSLGTSSVVRKRIKESRKTFKVFLPWQVESDQWQLHSQLEEKCFHLAITALPTEDTVHSFTREISMRQHICGMDSSQGEC